MGPLLQLFFLSLLIGFLAVYCAPAPGVTVANQTLSCCGQLDIPLVKDCLNRFSIEDRCLAQVNGTEFKALEPFHFLPDEGMMQVLKCVDFTHENICDVGDNYTREERVGYQLTPCHKHGAPSAATVQGSDLSLLLTVALLIAMFH